MIKLTYGLLAISSLSFWFILGFPFANRMESYAWIAQLNNVDLSFVLTTRMDTVVTFRPLAQALAWLGYRLSGGLIYPIELFNFLVAVLSWFVLFLAMEEKRIFSAISLVVGGVFFSGYIYLFHLHGVFYSPLLLLIAFLFRLRPGTLTNAKISVALLLGVFLVMFHPFAFLISITFTVGLLVEKGRNTTIQQLVLVAFLGGLSLVFANLLTPGNTLQIGGESLQGLLATYKTVEVNKIISLISIALCICAALSTPIGQGRKVWFALLAIAIVLISWMLMIPLVVIWILFCFLKVFLMRQWSIAFLLTLTFMFPAFTGTGSPTYSIFVLMICAATVPWGWTELETKLVYFNQRFALSLVVVILTVGLLLRLGVHLPVISGFVDPILSERERTFQLETIVRWIQTSQYRDYDVFFSGDVSNPAESLDTALDRTHRPPTTQAYLRVYLDSFKRTRQIFNDGRRLIISFGSEKSNFGSIVHAVQGQYAGEAVVYLPLQ